MSSEEPPQLARPGAKIRWIMAGSWLVAVGFIIFCADRRLLRPMFALINGHPGLDKVGHFLLIGGTAFVLNIALGLRDWPAMGRRWLLGSTLVAIGFTVEEFTQLWFPSRTFDLLDLACDYTGILVFGWLARRLFKPRSQV